MAWVYEFIGGPIDGDLRALPDDQVYCVVPVLLSPARYVEPGDVPPVEHRFMRVFYVRERGWDGERFMVLDSFARWVREES